MTDPEFHRLSADTTTISDGVSRSSPIPEAVAQHLAVASGALEVASMLAMLLPVTNPAARLARGRFVEDTKAAQRIAQALASDVRDWGAP